jgi:hypothetical protein
MKMYKLLFAVPVCALAIACGGESTPPAESPAGAASSEPAPAENATPKADAPKEGAPEAPAGGDAPAAP